MSLPQGITDAFERHLYLAMPQFEREAFHEHKRWTRVSCYLRKIFFSDNYQTDPVATLKKEADRHVIFSAEWGVVFGQFPGDPNCREPNTYADRMKQSLLVEFPLLEEAVRVVGNLPDLIQTSGPLSSTFSGNTSIQG